MAWTDAARAASAAARKRMHGAMKRTKFDRASVAHALRTNRRVYRGMHPGATIRQRNLLARRMTTVDINANSPRKKSIAQQDREYARAQRKAGKSSIFGGTVMRKLVKGFEKGPKGYGYTIGDQNFRHGKGK